VESQEKEIQSQRIEVKELKTQLKKLNQILYGRR
jgi:hypothetical protein